MREHMRGRAQKKDDVCVRVHNLYSAPSLYLTLILLSLLLSVPLLLRFPLPLPLMLPYLRQGSDTFWAVLSKGLR
jgi:hypothetical protein